MTARRGKTGLDTRLCPCEWCAREPHPILSEKPDPIAAGIYPQRKEG